MWSIILYKHYIYDLHFLLVLASCLVVLLQESQIFMSPPQSKRLWDQCLLFDSMFYTGVINMNTVDDHQYEWYFWRKRVWEYGCLTQQGTVDSPTTVGTQAGVVTSPVPGWVVTLLVQVYCIGVWDD